MSAEAVTEFATLLGIATGITALGCFSLWLSTRSLAAQASAVFMSTGIAVSIPLTVGDATVSLVAALIVRSKHMFPQHPASAPARLANTVL